MGCRAFFAIPAAGGAFFVSSWILMLFSGIVSDELGIKPIGYVSSMVVTIGLWLVVAPVVGAIVRRAGFIRVGRS